MLLLQVRSDRLKKVDPKFVQRNAAFLLDTLLSLVSCWFIFLRKRKEKKTKLGIFGEQKFKISLDGEECLLKDIGLNWGLWVNKVVSGELGHHGHWYYLHPRNRQYPVLNCPLVTIWYANLPIASASASGTRYPKLKKDRISPTKR